MDLQVEFTQHFMLKQKTSKKLWIFCGYCCILSAIRGILVKKFERPIGHRLHPCVRKIPWRRKWQPTPVFLPGESREQSSLADSNPQGRKESDTTKQLTLPLFNPNKCVMFPVLHLKRLWLAELIDLPKMFQLPYLEDSH